MKIKCLLIMPGKEVQIIKIPASIKFIKAFIGENLYKIRLNENTLLIANRDANIEEINRFIGGDIILGTFIIISIKNNRKVSMKKRDIAKFTNMFKLRKHKKIDIYKKEYIEEYYANQRKIKQQNAERNRNEIFNIAA